jgi:hypothetical protein
MLVYRDYFGQPTMQTDPKSLGEWIKLLLSLAPYVVKAFQWGKERIVNRFKWRGISEEARKIALAIHQFSWTYLNQPAQEINHVGSIPRPEIDQIQNIWNSSDTPLLLHGEAGAGKSGIALRLGRKLIDDGIPVLFLRVTDFPTGQESISIIQNRLANNLHLMDALSKLGNERIFAVIVDQLDSVAGTDLGKNFIGFLKALAGLKNAKILAVSRSYERLHDPDISALEFQSIEIGKLTNEQSLEYLSRLGLKSPTRQIIELSRNLLNLSLISDVVLLTPDHQLRIIDEVELWKRFYATIQQREGDDVAEYVLRLAREVTTKGQRSFQIQFPNIRTRRKLLSRDVIVETSVRRFSFRHERLQDFLCAYSLLPNQPTVLQILEEFGVNSSKGVIYWLQLLCHAELSDIESTFIDDVLGSKDKLPFYTRIQILENLKIQLAPRESVAKVIAKHLAVPSYNRFFFADLDNPEWIVPLYKVKMFHSPPPPNEVQPNSFQIPFWPAGEYLSRYSNQYEEIVIDVVQSIKTENWRVQEIMTDMLIKISPDAASRLITLTDSWLNGRFSDMLPNKLISLADHFIETGFVDAAIQILESVVAPILLPDKDNISKYFPPIRFRADRYWTNQYCEKQLIKLITLNPAGVVSVFERQLIKTIELIRQIYPDSAESMIGYVWRMDITNSSSDRSEADALDIMIEGLRDGLAEICKSDIVQGGKILETYLSGEHLIFQRTALFTLRTYGHNYPDLLNSVLIRRNYFENAEYSHEYIGLMRDQLCNASKQVKDEVISWILAGPHDLDLRASHRAQWENRTIAEDDLREEKEKWILFHLEIIRGSLSGETLDRLNELTKIYGKPDIEEKPRFTITTGWGGVPSPVTAEELSRKTFDEIQSLFLVYVPEDTFLNPRESLAQTFQVLVREDPTRYSDFASYLIHSSMRYVYVYYYLLGIRESVKNKNGKLTNAIIGLCEYVVLQTEDPFLGTSGDHEAGLIAAQLEVANLLKTALRSDDPYLTGEQLGRIRLLLIELAHYPDLKEANDKDSSFDPFTHSLNCVKGMAMHGIMHYSLYLRHRQEKLGNEKVKAGNLEPEINNIFDEKLNLSIESSLAVHSVFGAYVPQLLYLDRRWLEEHLVKIFPDEEERYPYWKAAWDAYIFTSDVYGEVFRLLVPQYRRGILALSRPQDDQKYFGGAPNEKFAQHMMSAYLSGLTDFGHENFLLDLFFVNAPDSVRANGIFWLSQFLGGNKPSAEDPLWKKCWALWQKRVEFSETQEVSLNSQEISEYMRWLDNCPYELDHLYPTLSQTVKYLHVGYDAMKLTSFAAKNSEKFPFEAVMLLKMIIFSAKESWWMPDEKDEEKILRIAMTGGNKEARQIAIEVINYRGEQGDFRWRQLLDL